MDSKSSNANLNLQKLNTEVILQQNCVVLDIFAFKNQQSLVFTVKKTCVLISTNDFDED